MTFGLQYSGYAAENARTHATSATTCGFPIRIGILHGNRLCAELLGAQCRDAWGCDVVVVEHSSDEGLQAVSHLCPDLVIVGHHPPTLDGLGVVSALQRYSNIKTIVCARRITEFLVSKLSRLNFHGILEETSVGLTDLRTAIQKLREGGRHLSSRYLNIAARLRTNPESFAKLLSQRQEEVLVCIAHEMEDSEISVMLGMSPATAQRHRNDIMQKLNLHKTPKLIRYCIQTGFNEASLPQRS